MCPLFDGHTNACPAHPVKGPRSPPTQPSRAARPCAQPPPQPRHTTCVFTSDVAGWGEEAIPVAAAAASRGGRPALAVTPCSLCPHARPTRARRGPALAWSPPPPPPPPPPTFHVRPPARPFALRTASSPECRSSTPRIAAGPGLVGWTGWTPVRLLPPLPLVHSLAPLPPSQLRVFRCYLECGRLGAGAPGGDSRG